MPRQESDEDRTSGSVEDSANGAAPMGHATEEQDTTASSSDDREDDGDPDQDQDGGSSLATLRQCGPQHSTGSAGHPEECTPCTFYCFAKRGCKRGVECKFCHLWHQSKIQLRREAWKQQQRLKRKERHGPGEPGSSSDRTLAELGVAGSATMQLWDGGAAASAPDSKQPPQQERQHQQHQQQPAEHQRLEQQQQQQQLRIPQQQQQQGPSQEQQLHLKQQPAQAQAQFAQAPPQKSRLQRQQPLQQAVQRRCDTRSGQPVADPQHGAMAMQSIMLPGTHVPQQGASLFAYCPASTTLAVGQQAEFRPRLAAQPTRFRAASPFPSGIVLDDKTGVVYALCADSLPPTTIVVEADFGGSVGVRAVLDIEVIDFTRGGFVMGHLEEVLPGRFMLLLYKPEANGAGGASEERPFGIQQPTFCDPAPFRQQPLLSLTGGAGGMAMGQQPCRDGGCAGLGMMTVATPSERSDSSEVGLHAKDLPSVGSAGHASRTCTPCAFVHKGVCQSGALCSFCHLCGPDEKRRRKKDRKGMMHQQRVL